MYYKEGFKQENLTRTIAARRGKGDEEAHELSYAKELKRYTSSFTTLSWNKKYKRENGPSINEEGGKIDGSCKMSELLNCCFQVSLYKEIGVWIIRK